MAALAGGLLSARAMAVTFVYVSNADDGDIGMYRLMGDGALPHDQLVRIAESLT